jgi:translation initiation factor IF-1
MVKNAGGNRGKKIGRKHLGGPKGTRTRSEDGEIYACVVRLYGGANCEVLCEDGKSRLCIIRNKFRGRGKRGNILSPGVWVMVGDRSWEGTSDGKLEKCDLLEVYNEADKKKLRSDDPSGKWDVLDTADPEKAGLNTTTTDDFEFDTTVDKTDAELALEAELAAEASGKIKNNAQAVTSQFGELIDIDDI